MWEVSLRYVFPSCLVISFARCVAVVCAIYDAWDLVEPLVIGLVGILLAFNSAQDHWVSSGADSHRQVIAKWPYSKNKRGGPIRKEDPSGQNPKRDTPAPVDTEAVQHELSLIGLEARVHTMEGWDFAVCTFENSSSVAEALSKAVEKKLKDVFVIDEIEKREVMVDGGRHIAGTVEGTMHSCSLSAIVSWPQVKPIYCLDRQTVDAGASAQRRRQHRGAHRVCPAQHQPRGHQGAHSQRPVPHWSVLRPYSVLHHLQAFHSRPP